MSGPGEALGALASRLGRHTAVYAAGSGIGFALALVNLAVLTRYLPVAQFGQLALLMVFAALLTVLYNLGTLQGGFMWVFGSSGEEGGEGDEREAGAGEKRRALGTAVVLTTLVAAAGTVAIVAAPGTFAAIVAGDAAMASEVRWAALSGGLGAQWRLLTNIPRFERHPGVFVALSTLRPLLVLAVSLPLVVGGYGLEGAVAGTALGTAGAVAANAVVTRRSFVLTLHRGDLTSIVRRGATFVPVILSFWIIQNLDIYILAQFTSDSEVGLYRVASRLASVVSYFVSAFLMAWMPLSRTAIHAAAVKERGMAGANAAVITYFAFAGAWLVLGLAVGADVLVKVAAESYAPAASVLPLLAAAFLTHGAFTLLYRGARFRHKRAVYVTLAVLAAVVFLAVSLVLVPRLGSHGAALAGLIAFALASAGILFFSQRGRHPLPLPWTKIGGAGALAGGLAWAAVWLSPQAGSLAPAVELLALIAFPVLVTLTGLIPREQLAPLSLVVRSTVPSRHALRRTTAGLERLDDEDRMELALLVRERRPAIEVARMYETSEPALLHRFVATLRTVGNVGGPSNADSAIGAYLLSVQPVAERDRMAKRLFTGGVEPLEVDALETTLRLLRRAPLRAWERR